MFYIITFGQCYRMVRRDYIIITVWNYITRQILEPGYWKVIVNNEWSGALQRVLSIVWQLNLSNISDDKSTSHFSLLGNLKKSSV